MGRGIYQCVIVAKLVFCKTFRSMNSDAFCQWFRELQAHVFEDLCRFLISFHTRDTASLVRRELIHVD